MPVIDLALDFFFINNNNLFYHLFGTLFIVRISKIEA